MLYPLFLFVLIFSPLAFGTVEYWSLGVIEILVPFVVLLLCGSLWVKKDPYHKVPGLVPLILLLCWMLLQLVPLPPGLVKNISPATYNVYEPLLQLSGSQPWFPLTINPRASLQELLRFGSYALFFILTVQLLGRSSDRLQKTVTLVVWLAIAIAIEALVQKLSSTGSIYWFRPAPPKTTPFGPWLYKNHFAGFMEMVFPLVLAVFLYLRPQVNFKESLRVRVHSFLNISSFNNHFLLSTGAMLIAVAIMLSVSRGGIVTLCMALFFFAVFSSTKIPELRKRWAVPFFILAMLMVTWLGGQSITSKFTAIWGEQGLNTKGRLPVLVDSLNIVKDFPLTGTGFGTFEFVYPGYRSPHGLSHLIYDHAHNDYIELLVTGGSIGFLLAAWFVIAVIAHSLRVLRHRREKYSILLTIGGITGILALLMHCFVDFQMYNGANGLYFFFLSGLVVSTANTRMQYRSRPTLLPYGSKFTQIVIPVLALTVFAGAVWFNSSGFRAGRLFDPIRSVYLNQNIPDQRLQEMYDQAKRSAQLDFLEPDYYFTMANISNVMGRPEQAGDEYLRACFLNPLSGMFVQRLALSLGPGKAEVADKMLGLGCVYEPLIFGRYVTYADWLINTGDRPRAMSILNRVLVSQPQWVSRLGGFVLINQLTREEIDVLLPDDPMAWHEMGRLMDLEGDKEEAEYYYLKTLEILGTDEARPEYFSRLYGYYRQQNEDDKALAVLNRGIEYLPGNVSFHTWLGDQYFKQGSMYRSREEYRQALQLKPGDIGLKRRLNDLEGKVK